MPSSHRRIAGSRRQFPWKPCSPCSGVLRGRAGSAFGCSPSRLRPTCSASRTARSSWSPGGASRSTSRIAMRSGIVSATAGWWVATAPSSVSALGGVVAAKQDCMLEDARFKLEDARVADVDPGEKHQREPPWSSRSGPSQTTGVGLGRAVSDPAEAGRAAAARAKVAGVSRSAWATCARCDARANGSRVLGSSVFAWTRVVVLVAGTWDRGSARPDAARSCVGGHDGLVGVVSSSRSFRS